MQSLNSMPIARLGYHSQYRGLPAEIRVQVWELIAAMPITFRWTSSDEPYSAAPEFWPRATILCLNSTVRAEATPILSSSRTTFDFSDLSWRCFEGTVNKFSQAALDMTAEIIASWKEGRGFDFWKLEMKHYADHSPLKDIIPLMTRQRPQRPTNRIVITFDMRMMRLWSSSNLLPASIFAFEPPRNRNWTFAWEPRDQALLFDMLRIGHLKSGTLRLHRATLDQLYYIKHGLPRFYDATEGPLPAGIRRTITWWVDLSLVGPELWTDAFPDRSTRIVEVTDRHWRRLEQAQTSSWFLGVDNGCCQGAFEGEIEFSLIEESNQ